MVERMAPSRACKAEDLVTFEAVAVYFTKAEWDLLRLPQKGLYREVMLENYGTVISLGSGRALEGDSLSSSFHPGVETVIMESAEGLEEVAVHFTAGEWELMDPGQKSLYEEVTLEINAMVAFLGHLRSRPDLIAFLEENGEDLFLEGPMVEERAAGEGPLEVLLERVVGQEWEEDLRTWREANQEEKIRAPTLREKSGPREESKRQTLKHNGKEARASSEAGEDLSSCSVLDVSEGIDREEESAAHRINLCCDNFSPQEMPVRLWRNHARGTSRTASNCGQNVYEETRTTHMRFHNEEQVGERPDCRKSSSGESDLSQRRLTHIGENQKTEINWNQKDRTRAGQGKSPDDEEKFYQSGPHILCETVPSGEKPYQCLECGVTFTLKGNLRRHQKYHTGEKLYQCSECGKSFDWSERLISHQRVHTGERPYQCSECGKSYYAKETLSRHQKIHARKPPSGEAPNVCLKCGKIFSDKSDVVRHQTVHTRKKQYTCPDCGKRFSQSGNLVIHRRIHTGEAPYQCVDCGKSFRRRNALTLHQRVHTGEKPYKCSECGKSFSRADVFSSHQKMHSGEKPLVCFECGKTFNHASNLRKHQIVHTGEKPYKCLECGKTFGHGSSLTSHHKIHTRKRPLKSLEGVKIEGMNT